MKTIRIHCAGVGHVVPLEGTPGHARVVARGCHGGEDGGYFSCGDENCALGYTWDCGDCPALPSGPSVEQQDIWDREGEALP